MIIDPYMNLDHLAERMGGCANHEEALTMCAILTRTDYLRTEDIPEAEWLDMLNRATR